ncbi:telomerase Cajal body protein 1 homolog [Teleopsis dalmanni]|uniref:telomerase Cajal body protein 1 homolog n=1 Tax=Teleopsis dalmanni TaxID=139649 RepID=UPI0018CE1846|nr:telomerase Cajal body protein 1 homolog [Teleopsis dalmanni]
MEVSMGTLVEQYDTKPLVKDSISNFEDCCDESYLHVYEIGRKLWQSNDLDSQHYLKGCLWSPDGNYLLVPVHLDGIHIFELPEDLRENDVAVIDKTMSNRDLTLLESSFQVAEGGTVYDFTWYPYQQSNDYTSCCWLSTRQNEPIHMWNIGNGSLRCSYRAYDMVDEPDCAISVHFSNDGENIYGGYKKSIKIFDTSRPGRDYSIFPVKQPVSCFATNPRNHNTVTVGSWHKHVYHYDLRQPKIGPLFVLNGHNGGITWLRYDTEGYMLFSGARKDDNILQYDLRNYTEPLHTYERKVATNQRISFDLNEKETWLVGGDSDGMVHVWDYKSGEKRSSFEIHTDCCNGLSLHPNGALFASTSGKFHMFEESTELFSGGREIVYENGLVMGWIQKRMFEEYGT